MTRDEILKIPAGKKMDTLIAKHVFNHRVFMTFKDWESAGRPLYDQSGNNNVFVADVGGNLPKFSSYIESAWGVLEKFNWYHVTKPHARIMVELPDGISVLAETVPLAICRAALLAVMDNENA